MKRDLEQLIHDLIGIVFDLTRRPGAHSQLALDGFRRDAEELRDRLGELEPAQPQPRGERDDLGARGEWDRAERIAQDFHETYERLAPHHAYRTRPESAVPWSEVPPANKALMIATVQEVLARASTHPEQAARVEAVLRERCDQQEKALEAIAERECEDFEDWGDEGIKRCPDFDGPLCASCLARAARSTSTKEDG